jgi:chromate transporter
VKEYVDLFFTFVKMGLTTFGGGYAMMPVIERELIKKRNWVTMDEVMDWYTIAQITPGIIAVNVSTFVGYKRKGPLGGILTTLGFTSPGVVFILLIAAFLANFADLPLVQHAFVGIRIAVGALITDTVIKMMKGVFKDVKALIIYIAAFVLSLVWGVSPVFIVLASGVLGFLFMEKPKTGLTSEKKGSEK